MSLACKTALVESDVAHLVLPDEVQTLPAESAEAGSPAGRIGSRRVEPDPNVVEVAGKLIASSIRPMIIVGNGARHSMDDIVALADRLGAPVGTTFKPKGLIPDQHPLGCGVLGRSGTPVASWLMNESDLLIVFGASSSNHTGIATYKPTIQVDFDPMALGRFHAVEVPMLSDVGAAATALTRAFPPTRLGSTAVLRSRTVGRFGAPRRKRDLETTRGAAFPAHEPLPSSPIVFPPMRSSVSTSGTTPIRSAATSR